METDEIMVQNSKAMVINEAQERYKGKEKVMSNFALNNDGV